MSDVLNAEEFDALKYRSIINSSINIVVVIDNDLKVLEINNFTPGVKRHQVIGKYLLELQSDLKQRKDHTNLIRRSLKEQKETTYETWAELNGKIFYYTTTVNPIVDKGKTLGATLVTRDITDEKNYKKELIASEKKYREVVENTKSLILRINPKGKILFANRHALDLLQYQKHELEGKNILDTIVPHVDENGKSLHEKIKQILSNPSEYQNFENENLKKDGTTAWISWGNYPQYDNEGNLTELLKIGFDITQIKSQQHLIKTQSELLNQLQEAIIISNTDGIIEFVNDSTCEILEYQESELLGQSVAKLYPESFKEKIFEALIQPTLDKGKHRLEVECKTKTDNLIPINLSLSVVKNQFNTVTGIVGCALEITERKKIERHRNDLAKIVESSNQIIGIADLNGRVTYVNKAGREILEISSIDGFRFMEYIAPEKRDFVEKEVMPIVMKTGRWAGETKFITKNGKRLDALFDIFLLKNENGEPTAFVTVSNEITALVNQRNELIKREAALKEAQSIGKIGSFEQDFVQDSIKWSDELYNIFDMDITDEVLSYEDYLKVIHEDDKVIFLETFHEQVKSTSPFENVHRVITRKNKLKYVHYRGRTEFDRNGKPIKIIGTASDITNQKLAERKIEKYQNQLEELVENRTQELQTTLKQLNASESKYKSLINTTALGISITVDEKIIFVNNATVKMFGLDDDSDMIGSSFFDFIDTVEIPRLSERYNKIKFGEHVPEKFIVDCKRKDGAIFTCQLSVKDLIYEGKKARHASFVDITELKVKEKQLLETSEKLKEAMRAKDEFLSIMSHEIRTPLNAVSGLSQLLLKKENGKNNDAILTTLNSSAEHLNSVVSDILDYSKIQAGKIELVKNKTSLNELIENAIKLHQGRADEKGLLLTSKIDPAIPRYVLTDANRLNQILYNLISNAIKFTNTGKVNVSVNISDQTHQKENSANIAFQVSDSGVGIAQKDLDNLFEPFTQAKEGIKKGGTGLGLSIVKNLIHILQGEINIASTLSKGTTVSFTLPFEVIPEIELEDNSNHQENKPLNLSGRKILYIEDVRTNQFLMENLLSEYQIECDIAVNGQKAIERLTEEQFDLIFLDIQLPDINGYELAKHIRENQFCSEQTPIIAFTADTRIVENSNYKKYGINDFLLKPIDISKVEDLLLMFIKSKPFDLKFYESAFKNQPKKLQGFYQTLVSDLTEFKDGINQAISINDHNLLKKNVHSLSSIVGHLNYAELQKAAIEIKNVDELNTKTTATAQSIIKMVGEVINHIKTL